MMGKCFVLLCELPHSSDQYQLWDTLEPVVSHVRNQPKTHQQANTKSKKAKGPKVIHLEPSTALEHASTSPGVPLPAAL